MDIMNICKPTGSTLYTGKKRTLQKLGARWTKFAFDYFESRRVQAFVATVAISSVVSVIVGYDDMYSCEKRRHEVNLTTAYYFRFCLDILLSVLTLLDYILALSFFPSKFGFLYSWRGISDSLAVLPIMKIFCLFSLQSHTMGIYEFVLSLFTFFRLSKICRIGLFYKQLNLPIGTYYVIVMVDVIVIFLLFVSAALLGVDHYVDEAFTQPLCIWTTSLYFTVSIISTVGFGDISANTTGTRILLSIIILIAVAMIPFTMANVMQLMSADRNTYSLSLYALPYDRWICICGISPSPQLIRDMLIELSNTPEECAFMVIILSPELPGIELSAILNDISYSHRIKYYLGSAKDPTDLARIRAEWANAIYIIGDVRFEASLRNQEDSNYLTCIAVNKYLNKKYAERSSSMYGSNGSVVSAKKSLDPALARLSSLSAYGGSRPVVVARLPYTAKNKQLLLNKGLVHVAVSQQEIKYALLSYGMIFPGFLSLFTQLCIQPADSSGITAPSASDRARACACAEDDVGISRILEIPLIQPDIVDSSETLFPLPKLSSQFLALTFEQAVCYLYTASCGRVVPIGVLQTAKGRRSTADTLCPNGMGKIFLNPSSNRGSREFNSELSQFQALFVVSSLHRWDVLREYIVNFDADAAYSMISNFSPSGTSVSERVRRSSINQLIGENNEGGGGSVKLRSNSITGIKEMIAAELEACKKTKAKEEALSSAESVSDSGKLVAKKVEMVNVDCVDVNVNSGRGGTEVEFDQLVRSVYTPLRPTSEKLDGAAGVGAPAVVALNAGCVADELVDAKNNSSTMPASLATMDTNAHTVRLSSDRTVVLSESTASALRITDPEKMPPLTDSKQLKQTPSASIQLQSPTAGGAVDKMITSNSRCVLPRFRGHILLIVATSSMPNTTARAYLIPIIAIIRTLRREVTQNVVILAEKIPDLQSNLEEIETAQPGLLRNVLFVEGTNRHLDHLQSCNLEYASVVLVVNPLVKAPRRDALSGGANNQVVSKDVDIISKQVLVEEDRAAVMATLNVLHALELIETDSREHLLTGWKPPYVVASIAHYSNALFLPVIPVHAMKLNDLSTMNAAGPVTVPTAGNYDESDRVQTQTDYISTGSVLLHGSIEMCACIQSVLNPNIIPLWEALLGVGMEQTHTPQSVMYRKVQSGAAADVVSDSGGNEESEVEEMSRHTCGRRRHQGSGCSDDETNAMDDLNRAADAASAHAAKIAAAGPVDPKLSASFSALDKICLPAGFAGRLFGELFPVLYADCGVIAIAVCRYLAEDQSGGMGHSRDSKIMPGDPSHNHVLLPQVLLPTAELELQEHDEIFIVLSALLE